MKSIFNKSYYGQSEEEFWKYIRKQREDLINHLYDSKPYIKGLGILPLMEEKANKKHLYEVYC